MLPSEITVQVTQEDIDDGIPDNTYDCAIACAVKREFIGYTVNVGKHGMYIWPTGESELQCYALPGEASDFIGDFDSGIPVEPFKFIATVKKCP